MHTYNLLTAHADRSTIAPEGLALLDAVPGGPAGVSGASCARELRQIRRCALEAKSEQTILEHFRLLQACDNLSLLTCVAFDAPAHLLHPLPLNDGGTAEIKVMPIGPRHFRLSPWPFAAEELQFTFPARHVFGNTFESSAQLESAYAAAVEELLR